MMSSRKVFVFLWIVGIVLYANSLQGDFVFDDHPTILNNPAIRDFTNIKLIWLTFNTRFLTGLSFAINYKLDGFNTFGYHVGNVIVHILSAFLVYIFVKLTFQTPFLQSRPLREKGPWIALCSALIFLVHPIQTEGVSYITQRATCLGALFYLTSLVLYIKSRLENDRRFLMAAVLASVLGMLTKEMTFTIPMMILAYEIFFLKTEKEDLEHVLKRLRPLFWTLLTIPLVLVLEQKQYSNFGLRDQIFQSKFYWINFLTQINILRTYLRLLVLPINQNLDYDYPAAKGLFEIAIWGSLLILIFLSSLVAVLYQRRRILSFCIVWFFITTSLEFVVGTFIRSDIVIFEHYLYLPMVGYAIFLSVFLFEWLESKRKIAYVFTFLLGLFSLLTVYRNSIWGDTERLIKETMAKSPNKLRPIYMLFELYMHRKQYDQTGEVTQKAFELDSQKGVNYYIQGVTYEKQGKIDEAIQQYEKAIQEYPSSTPAENYFKLAYLYHGKKFLDKAESLYKESIRLNPRLASAYCNLGNLYMTQGKYNQAIDYYKQTLQVDPYHLNGRNGLASAYVLMGDYKNGIREYQKMIEMYPQESLGYKNLGKIYFLLGDSLKAEELFKQVLYINNKDPEVYQYLAKIYYQLNRMAEAEASIKKAVHLLEEGSSTDTLQFLPEWNSTP